MSLTERLKSRNCEVSTAVASANCRSTVTYWTPRNPAAVVIQINLDAFSAWSTAHVVSGSRSFSIRRRVADENCSTDRSLTFANAGTVTVAPPSAQIQGQLLSQSKTRRRAQCAAPARPIYRYRGRTEVLLVAYPFHSPAVHASWRPRKWAFVAAGVQTWLAADREGEIGWKWEREGRRSS